LEYAQKWYDKHANKTHWHVKFEVGQHMWLNVWDLKMFDRLAPHFIVTYVKLYENLHKPHLDLYTLKLQINFVAHPIFQVSKFKLFLFYEQRPNLKQSVQLEVSAIEHRLVVKIKNILNIGLLSKSKTYFAQGIHTLEAKSIW
jgi:hypothetical protein